MPTSDRRGHQYDNDNLNGETRHNPCFATALFGMSLHWQQNLTNILPLPAGMVSSQLSTPWAQSSLGPHNREFTCLAHKSNSLLLGMAHISFNAANATNSVTLQDHPYASYTQQLSSATDVVGCTTPTTTTTNVKVCTILPAAATAS